MRRFSLTALVLLLALCWARCAFAEAATENGASSREESALSMADGIDVSGAQRALDEAGAELNLRALMLRLSAGEFPLDAQDALTGVARAAKDAAAQSLPALGGAAFPLFLWAFVSRLLPDDKALGARVAGYACYLACVITLISCFANAFGVASRAVESISDLTDAFTPVLVALLALTGGTRSASLITPMGALASRLIALAVEAGALTLCGALASLAAAGGVGGWLKLKRLNAFVKSFVKWLLRAMVGAYLALMSTGGLISGAYDGVTLKSAKFAADNLLPIIGGSVAGTMESLAASAALLRAAVGLTGSAALFAVCFQPMLSCALMSVSCRFLSAVSEPVGDEEMLAMLDSFSGAFSALLAVVAASATLMLILIGATVGLGARMLG